MLVLEGLIGGASYIALALLTGALSTSGVVLDVLTPPKLTRTLFALAAALLIAFLVIGVFSLIVQGAKLSAGELPSFDLLSRYVFRTQSGRVWLARELHAALLLLVTLRCKRNGRSAVWLLLLVLPLAGSRSLMSHAAAVRENTIFAISSDAVHLMATALWAGGLPILCWTFWHGRKRLSLPLVWGARIVARFSRLALSSVAILFLTGLYQSWIHVQTWNALFGTSYGRLLLAKISLFLAMVSLGALNFLFTRRDLLMATESNALHVRRKALGRIGAESLLGLSVLSVTGFLTILPPGSHGAHGSPPGRSAASSAHTHGHFVPAEGASVEILSPKEGQVFKSDEIPVHFEFVKGKRGHHIHAYVDGELMGMFESKKGALTGIQPGRHVLEARVAAEEHGVELNATDRVSFVVEGD